MTEMKGWIDDPNDPWVGFLVERCAYEIHTGEECHKNHDWVGTLVRVRPNPDPEWMNSSIACSPAFEVHPEDCGKFGDYSVSVCRHMGRFVE